jgi:hypothetical protein
MSITADPLFIAAEVAWRQQNLTAGLPTVARARHRHTIRWALATPRLHHRHAARHTARHA